MKNLIIAFLIILGFCQNGFSQEEEDQYEQFVFYLADSIRTSFLQDNGRFVDSIFNKEEFAKRILIDKPDDEKIENFNQYFYETELRGFQFGKIFSKELQGAEFYDFVNYYTSVDGKLHLLYRLFDAEEGINYHDFEVDIDSSIQMVDVYIYVLGQHFSETMHTYYKNALREDLENENRFIKQNNSSKSIGLLSKSRKELAAGKVEEALATFEKIPEGQRQENLYHFHYVQLAAEVSDSLYLKSLQDWEIRNPENPAVFLHGIDKFSLQGKYDLVLRYIDKLDNKIGLDPFLDYYRGSTYLDMKDLVNAQKYYEQTNENFSFFELDVVLFYIYSETNQMDKLIPILDIFHTNHGNEISDIKDWVEKDYPSVAKDPQYQLWKEKNKN